MRRILLVVPLAFCFVSSCKDDEIRTYRVAADEVPETPAPPTAPVVQPVKESPRQPSAVTWQAPADWTLEKAGQFLTAAYSLPTGGRVTVSKLGGDGGGLAANINRWRGQVGFKPLAEKDVIGQPLKVTDSDQELQLFNLTAADSAADVEGILAAVLPLGTETWYFKFTAPVGTIRKGEGVFAEFLRSIRIGASIEPAPQAPSDGAKKIKVTPPESWTASEGSAMRAASFAISGPDQTTADVSVIPIPGDSGSLFDNVNLWRAQLKLKPLASADDPSLSDRPTGGFQIRHIISEEPIINGKKAAIGAVVIKRRELTWFFKIIGEASLVEANLEKFRAFVQTATYPE
jgi:hypothetical protein